jgi:serine/threonine protein kinase
MSELRPKHDNTLEAGRRIGRYEILSLLARGGMGAVYLARAVGVGGFSRLFAIKVMHPHLADDEEFVHMLVDEARLASRIHHPNAIGILDFDDSEFGYYLVMDYVEGVNLRKVLSSKTIAGEERARIGVRMVIDALQGLHAAHELVDDAGRPLAIVHRDVSPHNIMVGADGIGRITDFGIALASTRIASSRPGMIKGKPQYMAPEQMLGSTVDRRADVFCAGIVLWEFLARRRLFVGENDAVSMLVVSRDPFEPPSLSHPVPDGFDSVCIRALERNPEDRYPTARAFAEALSAVVDAAGWAMTPHEVAERIGGAFSEEISRRKALVRERNAASEDVISGSMVRRSAVPATTSTGAAVAATAVAATAVTITGPAVGADAPSDPVLEFEEGAPSGDSKNSSSGASRARSAPLARVEAGPIVESSSRETPREIAQEVPRGTAAVARAGAPAVELGRPEARPDRRRAALVLGGILALAGASLVGVRLNGGSSGPPEATTSSEARTDGDSASSRAATSVGAAPRAMESARGGGVSSGDRDAGAAVTTTSGATGANGTARGVASGSSDTSDGASASSGGGTGRAPAGRERAERPPTSRRASASDAGASGESRAPVLETNPYLRH